MYMTQYMEWRTDRLKITCVNTASIIVPPFVFVVESHSLTKDSRIVEPATSVSTPVNVASVRYDMLPLPKFFLIIHLFFRHGNANDVWRAISSKPLGFFMLYLHYAVIPATRVDFGIKIVYAIIMYARIW